MCIHVPVLCDTVQPVFWLIVIHTWILFQQIHPLSEKKDSVSKIVFVCVLYNFVFRTMPFDFWDDVVLPAWHDIARCRITHEALENAVMAIDEHHSRISRDPVLRGYVMRWKKLIKTSKRSSEEDRLTAYVAFVACYKRGQSGVQNFIQDIQSSSFPSNVAVGGLLERIWEARKNDHPEEDVNHPCE